MNESLAKKKAAQLYGKRIGGYVIDKYIACGKTAYVCKGSDGIQDVAVKIFETDIMAFEEIEELKVRLERQLSIRELSHPNLVRIFDGGYSEEHDCYFLVMQWLDAPRLSDIIKEIPRAYVGSIITQIASAAEFLEGLEIAHRDIKPDNIVVSRDFSRATLLDLGVIRPVGKKGITDASDSIRFLGTARYSPLEFLLRKEEDSQLGWRAVTFYQVGAVLHDIIMRYPIFEGQAEPSAALIHAVEFVNPPIHAEDVDIDLVHLAKICLLKEPKLRIEHLTWDSFRFPKKNTDFKEVAKRRILERAAVNSMLNSGGFKDQLKDREQFLYDMRSLLEETTREACVDKTIFPRSSIEFKVGTDQLDFLEIINFSASEAHSIASDFHVLIAATIIDQDAMLFRIQVVGILGDHSYEDILESKFSVLYEGSLEKAPILNNLQTALNVMFDEAQAKCDCMRDGTSTDPWIIFKLNESE
jgi:serine/threonine protein kinase